MKRILLLLALFGCGTANEDDKCQDNCHVEVTPVPTATPTPTVKEAAVTPKPVTSPTPSPTPVPTITPERDIKITMKFSFVVKDTLYNGKYTRTEISYMTDCFFKEDMDDIYADYVAEGCTIEQNGYLIVCHENNHYTYYDGKNSVYWKDDRKVMCSKGENK